MPEDSMLEKISRLQHLRNSGGRHSVEIIDLAQKVWCEDTRKCASRLGDDVWLFYEQVAISALDLGKRDLAERCVQRLEQKFPGSARVMPLHGMLLESRGELKVAKDFYELELSKPVDPKASNQANTRETNVRIRKRLIALHLYNSPLPSNVPAFASSAQQAKVTAIKEQDEMFSLQDAVCLLVDHLDTVYSDPESWIQLAETYCTLGLYPQALSALEDLTLIQPNNTFHLLRYAETAYTAAHYELAYKTFLRVIESSDKISDACKGGPSRRAAIGLKVCIAKLSQGDASRPKHIGNLVADQLLECYSQDWVPLQPGLRVASESCRKALIDWLT